MLAKGRLLGIQFEELMTDGLYTQLAATPTSWPTGCGTFSVPPVIPCSLTPLPTSSSPILPDADYAVLRSTSEGEFWTRVDESHSAIRFCTSWCTTKEAADRLEAAVSAPCKQRSVKLWTSTSSTTTTTSPT